VGSGVVVAMAVWAQVQVGQPTLVYNGAINQAYRLRITATYRHISIAPNICCSTFLRILLVDRINANRFWEIATIQEQYEHRFVVIRADERTVVLSRQNPDYGGDQGSTKLFFDVRSKRLLKRIDFETSQDIVFATDDEARRTLQVSSESLAALRARRVFAADYEDQLAVLPDALVRRPLPQSTYEEFARARPDRVRDGYDAQSTHLEERIGAYQASGDRLWFGKAFYDDEGTSGVGAVGFVDSAGTYAFLRIPELFDWSVAGFLIENDRVWVGRVVYPEGATGSGGLLEYDLKTQRVTLRSVPDVIHAIAHIEGVVFLGTTHGLYVIRGGQYIRYRAEPSIDGQFIVISEDLSASPAGAKPD
jgi:hypothetical protein